MKVIKLFPCIFNDEDNGRIEGPMSLEELKYFLERFKKVKSLGPYSCPVELYRHFSEKMGLDLLAVI